MPLFFFGRAYNAFTNDINMSIPHKFATRGIKIVPYDFLSIDDEECEQSMYWGNGVMLMRAAQFVERHPQLYRCLYHPEIPAAVPIRSLSPISATSWDRSRH